MLAQERQLGNRRGFTLLELLSVMMIGIILMSISAAAYFGLVRGSAMSGAVSSVRTVLSLARQNAISSRKRTYVILEHEADHSRLCVAQHVGTHIGYDPPIKFAADVVIGNADEYVGSRVFNIDSKVMGVVSNSQDRFLMAKDSDNAWITWAKDDRCAVLIHDWVDLPSGLQFTSIPNLDLYFKQDGSVPDWGGDGYVIAISEDIGSASGELRVESISGTVRVVLGSVD